VLLEEDTGEYDSESNEDVLYEGWDRDSPPRTRLVGKQTTKQGHHPSRTRSQKAVEVAEDPVEEELGKYAL